MDKPAEITEYLAEYKIPDQHVLKGEETSDCDFNILETASTQTRAGPTPNCQQKPKECNTCARTLARKWNVFPNIVLFKDKKAGTGYNIQTGSTEEAGV